MRKYRRSGRDAAAAGLHGRHQSSTALQLPAAELPHRPPDQPRRFFDRLSRLRRERRAGRHQGVSPVVAGAAHRRRHRARKFGGESDVVPLWHEVLFRGRPRTGQDQSPERRARAELLSRQRNGLHGDALRARPHATAADPAAAGPDVGAPGASCIHAPAQRPARSAYAQTPASRHQARQRLPADRWIARVARFWRRAADADVLATQARADVHAGIRRAGAVSRP